jgi:hypothetical protein
MTPEEVVVNYEKKHHSFVDLTGRTIWPSYRYLPCQD